MGKKLDKKAKAAVAKAAKGIKAEKAVKKFRKLESKLWTREYLLKIAEFDGATIAPANGAAARADAMGTLTGEHHKLLTSEKSVELVRSLARETVVGGKIDDPQLLDEIRVLGRDQREASAIPTEEAEAWTRLTCEADAVWHKAKSANDWASTFGSGAAPRTRRSSSRTPAAWTLMPATTAATCRTSSPHSTSCRTQPKRQRQPG